MIKKMETFLYNRLLLHSFTSDYEKFLFSISLVACIYAILMHLFLLFFHLTVGVWPLVILFLAGFMLDILLFRLVDKGYYAVAGILLTTTIVIHTLASAICIGPDNLVIMYPLLTLMMQIVIPYASIRIRAAMIAVLWACMISLFFIGGHMVPMWHIGEVANRALTFFNIHLMFFGVVTLLTIGNVIWDAIIKYNQAELKRSKSEANTDPLTGLFNRRYADTFFTKLSTGQHEQVWCVAMLDIDDFKLINDINGHQVGDGVLILLSNLIKTSLRKTDVVFRWGGEEFLILLKGVNVSSAFSILDKLRDKIEEETLETHNLILKITVTIGVCSLDIDNVKQSIDVSDRLMYKGKRMGKNTVVM